MIESISDIVREMREWPHHEVLGNWPDRIEAVAGVDAELFAVCVKERNALHDEVTKLRNELAAEMRTCERLRAALAKIELSLRLFAAPEVGRTYIERTRRIALDALEGDKA